MDKKKIIFATIEAGGGHRTPALAISKSLEQLFPGKYDIRIMDFMRELGAVSTDNRHKRVWKFLLSHPLLTKSVQLVAFFSGPIFRSGFRVFLIPFYKPLRRFIQEEQPDLIFSTHYFNTLAVSHIRQKYRLDVTLINYLTEIFDLNSYWFLKDVDHYIVASEKVREKMLRWRFPEKKLELFPYPVRKNFLAVSRTKDKIAADLGIDASRKTLLITLGVEGIAPMEKFLTVLVERDFSLNVVVVTGKNQELRQKIEKKFNGQGKGTRVMALGFVTNLNELIYLSDLCFIKPGPATTWEVISFKKPIIFCQSAQLSEGGNIKFVCQNKVGFSVGNRPKKLIRILELFLNGEAFQECSSHYAKLNIENGSEPIAGFLDVILSRQGSFMETEADPKEAAT